MDMTKYPNYIFDEAFHVEFKVGETKLISIVEKPMEATD